MTSTCLPNSLLELLTNTVILDHLIPHLTLSSLFSLARTCRSVRNYVLNTPDLFRRLDLSRCRGAYIPPTITRIDSGGHSWRSERIDENLTEDEFYAGPLRGVLANLTRLKVLQAVQTLVLDDLFSVTHELVTEMVTDELYNIRILSIRQCTNVNQKKLQQLLCYICRPSRPEGTPRLRGLYVFGKSAGTKEYHFNHPILSLGVTHVDGAQLGTIPGLQRSSDADDPWYAPSGCVIKQGYAQRSSWEETLQTCRGIITFDGVLCSSMHAELSQYWHDASKEYLSQHKPAIPPMATIALGPDGCASCGKAPTNTPIWGESDIMEFPLLEPPPYSGRLLDAVKPPTRRSGDGDLLPQRLIVACSWCVVNRHCDVCHRWWCGDCYDPKMSRKLKELESLGDIGLDYLPSRSELNEDRVGAMGESVKVFNGLCVENCLVTEMMAGAGSGGMWG